MDINTQKEEFSYAYIYSVAAATGYSFQIAPRPLDAEGVDIIITGLGASNSIRRHCGYWISLRGLPPTQNQNTITVQIPSKNIFNKDALKTIMQHIESGEF